MTNVEIAKLLRNVAAAYTVKDENKYRFQILAYQKAADSIENQPVSIANLLKEDKLDIIPGVGAGIKDHLTELIKTEKVKHFEDLFKNISSAMFKLLEIPGFGPKKSYKLVEQFELQNPNTVIDDLEIIAKKGKIAELEGFGEKSEAEILRAIQEYKKGSSKPERMTLPYASKIAEDIVNYIRKNKNVQYAYPLGSLRRRKDTIGDVDIAAATNNPEAVIKHFLAYPHKERILEKGDTTAGILLGNGKHIDLMTMEPKRFGSLLQHFTGSKDHNVQLREYALKKGYSLSEYGIKEIKNSTKKEYTFHKEEEFYKFLGMSWIPPEIRENTGEIELAVKHKLPKLVELKDIKGDFHLHSSFPIEPSHDMGIDSMEEMIKKAVSLNYKYIGFSEHNPSISNHTTKQIEKLLERKYKQIEQLRLKYNKIIRLYSLLEVNILADGSIAINENTIKFLDFFIVGIHSVLNMSKTEMTKRILKGLSHPKARILAHPTGRLINKRPGYELDWNIIFNFCKENHKALEINAYPDRLDLPDILVRQAVEKKIDLVINTDSHLLDQMDLMQYGVSVARRGWAQDINILNTKEYNEIEEWIRR